MRHGGTSVGHNFRQRHAAPERRTHVAVEPWPVDPLYGSQADVEPLPIQDLTEGIIDGGSHILPDSLGMDLFAETIVPPRVLGALPALPDEEYPEGSLVFLTTDGKLYRNVADAWTVEVDGADVLANSITAGQIAAGAIGADEIAASAITTEKFHVGAFAPNVENSTSEVLIDDDGITILNGKISLLDLSGRSVLRAAGFDGAWIDFLARNTYNQGFVAGSTSAVGTDTMVGTASTQDDYEASLSADIPYWIVDEKVENGGSVTRVADAASPTGWVIRFRNDVECALIQDVPVVPGQMITLFTDFMHDGTGSFDYEIEMRHQWRDEDHAAIGSETVTTQPIDETDTGFESFEAGLWLETDPAPVTARYLRITWKYTHVAGTVDVLLGQFWGHVARRFGPTYVVGSGIWGSFTTREFGDTSDRLVIDGNGNMFWGDGQGALGDWDKSLQVTASEIHFTGATTFVPQMDLQLGVGHDLIFGAGAGEVHLAWATTDIIELGANAEIHSDGEAWINVSFQNSWGNVGGAFETAQYRKDALGFVHLKGAISGGSLGNAAFTLPAGFRPSGTIRFACNSNSAFASVTVDSAGVVTPTVGATTSLMLATITFKAV